MCMCYFFIKLWNSVFCTLLRVAVNENQTDKDLVRVWKKMDDTTMKPLSMEMTI